MSVKEELHDLVDQLEPGVAPKALDYLRSLVEREQSGRDSGGSIQNAHREQFIVSGSEFFAKTDELDLAELAKQQGVKPINDPDDLRADFWPEDESIDEFVRTIRQWRREGGYA